MPVEPQTIRFSPHGKLITIGILVSLALLLLSSIGHVLTPFIAAIVTAYLFNPIVSWLHRRTGVRRAVWIIVLYLIVFSLIYWLGTWLWPRILRQYGDLVASLPGIVRDISAMLEGHKTIQVGSEITIDLTPLEEQLIGTITDIGRTMSEGVPHLVFSALETALYTLVYLIVTFYLLLQSQDLSRWVVQLIPPPFRAEICELGSQIDQVLGAYIRGQLLLIVIMAVLIYIPLAILDVPYALVIAIASGVLELIPILGPWSAALIAMVVAFFQPEVPFGLSNASLAGLIGLIYLVLRQIEDSFIIPNVVGPLVRLHPAVVIFAVLAGGSLGGAIGLLLSIPAAAVMRILLSYLYGKMTDTYQIQEPPDPPGKAAEVPVDEMTAEAVSSSSSSSKTAQKTG